MKRIKFYCISFIVSFLIQVDAFSKEKIRFGTFSIPGLVINEEQGVFVDLTQAIAKRAHLNIEIVVKPRKRILKEFSEGKADVFFPALDVDFPSGKEWIKSEGAIFKKRDFVFTRKGESPINTIKGLEGKRVGITLGYPYAKELTENSLIKFDTTGSDILNALKLVNNRIDAFVVEEKAGLKAFQMKGLIDKVQYDPTAPISEMRDYYVFQNSEKGKRLAEIISRILNEMKSDGTYNQIISK